MGMDATLYSTTLTEVLRQVPYEDLERGFTGKWISNSTPGSEHHYIFNLDSFAKPLQKWSETNLEKCGYITLFLSPELIKEIETHIKIYDDTMNLWNERVLPLLSDPKKVLYIEFS
ncbi:hypothetical protein EBU94_09015 [bacterium]|nr:hypothetical protein [bacterium]